MEHIFFFKSKIKHSNHGITSPEKAGNWVLKIHRCWLWICTLSLVYCILLKCERNPLKFVRRHGHILCLFNTHTSTQIHVSHTIDTYMICFQWVSFPGTKLDFAFQECTKWNASEMHAGHHTHACTQREQTHCLSAMRSIVSNKKEADIELNPFRIYEKVCFNDLSC